LIGTGRVLTCPLKALTGNLRILVMVEPSRGTWIGTTLARVFQPAQSGPAGNRQNRSPGP
jgi:hypothetical protein